MHRPGTGTCSNGTISHTSCEQGSDAILSRLLDNYPSCYAEGRFCRAGVGMRHTMGRYFKRSIGELMEALTGGRQQRREVWTWVS